MVCLGRSDIPFQSERIEPYIQTKHSARTPRTMLQRYIRMLHMLQWFVHVCCKCLFSMFYLFFRRMLQVFYLNVTYVSHIYSKCFICMLRMFVMVFKCFQVFL